MNKKIVWLKQVNEFSCGAKHNVQWRGSRSVLRSKRSYGGEGEQRCLAKA